MADLPFTLPEPLADRLRAAADVEGKLVRVLDELGGLAGRDVGLLDVPAGQLHDRLARLGIGIADLPPSTPLRLGVPDGSLHALISLWSAFQGVDPRELAEADRVLRPDGRLLVVHDYGRDDVAALADPALPAYRSWSRRDGPFLKGGFRVRVVHAFWTFASLEECREFLADAFGERGVAVGTGLKRPRLAWNVAVYHRDRGGVRGPVGDPATLPGR